MRSLLRVVFMLLVLQQATWAAKIGYVPRDSSGLGWGGGIGIGIPYGVMGGKVFVGGGPVLGEVGVGLAPFVWDPVISVGGSLYFAKPTATVRPKISAAYSNIAVIMVIYDESATELLYGATYPGWAAYGGVDWRLGRTSPFCVDLSVGWIFPTTSKDEIWKRYNDAVDRLSTWYRNVDRVSNTLDSPKISIGLTYAPFRSLTESIIP